MRVRQFHQSGLFTFGLPIAALTVVCCICSVSHGQTVSAKEYSGVVKLVETSSFDNLPSSVFHKDSSPSDSQETKAINEETASNREINQASGGLENPSSSTNAQVGITPMQNRELTIRVQAVSISHEKIGTGLVPKSGSLRNTEQVMLPSGISRGMQYTHVCWKASNIRHFPLYFEDAMLERHGHTRCFLGFEVAQSLVSGAKFFGTIPLLPYLGTLRPRHDCVYALGHYRPGSCAPCLRDNIPYDAKAAIVESASAAAFFWAVPL